MRTELHWDVLFVLEDEALRRANDLRHYQLAHQLRRTLVTMDRDYLDDERFPPGDGAGVVVISGPDERALTALLGRVDRALFPAGAGGTDAVPLAGRKLHVHTDWTGEL